MADAVDVLELAVLGLLHETPDARLRAAQAAQRHARRVPGALLRLAVPVPKSCSADGLIARGTAGRRRPRGLAGKRARIVYQLTAEGKEHFAELLAETGPAAWEDEDFGVHFAFFGRTDAETRLRILEGRRTPAGGAPGRLPRRPRPAAGSGSTATPSSCSGTAWSRSSARSAG